MLKYITFCLTLISFLSCQEPEKVFIIEGPVPMKNTTGRVWDQGWLQVPENRTNKSSNTIELPFVFAKVPDSIEKATTPVLIMSGGPGSSSLHMPNGVTNKAWGENRDVLVMDQRGTKYAKPFLTCPEVDSLRILGLQKGLWGKALDSLYLKGVASCHEKWTTQNTDLNGYNTLESVADIESLRKALNIDKLILYGMSYSCNLMTAYAQTYPENTKALILDSPLPHHVNYDEDAFENIDTTLKNVVSHYTGSLELYNQWTDHISFLKDSIFSISIDSIRYSYTRNELIDRVLDQMSSHGSLPNTPIVMQNIIDGNHVGIEGIINSYLGYTRQAKGMRYSVWISEELPEESEIVIRQKKKALPWLSDYYPNDVSFATQDVWPVASIYDHWDWPNESFEGPTYILSGEFDPWTPPWYGAEMLEKIPNAILKKYPEHSHLPGFTQQGFQDIAEFLANID
ncbi:alpha/beta hydrolase [Aureisphaera galaxeae]|uniref:alpha/beta hydrolase n=1 Tax=Aureisphaera galaxeae TaxID=1538023 RepID=UPI00234FED9C|nr:alpha/beta hydrolase [Aureisphaera galaxeae]MDC8002483.1 alpha/beta hydrolase [Aureisphaera galaxeae]